MKVELVGLDQLGDFITDGLMWTLLRRGIVFKLQ